MKKIYKYLMMIAIAFILCVITFFSSAQAVMTITGVASQNFDALGSAGGIWIDNNTIPNWYWEQDLFSSIGYLADDGSSEPLSTTRYAYYGIGTSIPEIAIGGISTNGTGFAMGIQFVNKSGADIDEVNITYTGEQWHVGCDIIASSKLTFWYKVSSSIINDLTPASNNGWTSVNSLDFISPVLISFTGKGQLDGNDPANRVTFSNISIPGLVVPNNYYVMFRWAYPDQGSKNGLAIDDVTVNFVGNTVCNGGNWNVRRNWNWGLPDEFTNAVINGAVIENTNNSCYNLIINAGKSLTINSGKIITINKDVLIKSDASGTGNLLNNGTLNITGSANVQLYIQGTTIHNGVYFSPPLSTIQAIDVSDIVYRYNAITASWVQVFGQLNVGIGYTVRSDNAITKTLTSGELCNSSVYIGGLVRQANPNNYGWNLVGNPFICGLDWEILNDIPSNYTNLTNGFYIRNSDGTLTSYVNGVGETSVIPPMQGFYVQVLQGQTTGNLNIPLNARVLNSHILYKTMMDIPMSEDMSIPTNDVFVYDNIINVKLSNEKETVICIYDILGKQVFSQKIGKFANCKIDMNGFISGIYIVKVGDLITKVSIK